MSRIVFVIIVFGWFLSVPQLTYACQCVFGGIPVCEEFWKVKAVFIGTVIENRAVVTKSSGYDHHQRAVRFSIDEGFRGTEGPEVEVYTGLGDADCGFGFRVSQQYLVYALEHEGKLVTGICTRTKRIAAAAEDLTYIRGLATSKPGGNLNIEILLGRRNDEGTLIQTPVTGMEVKVEGTKRTVTRKSDTKGRITMEGLTAGEYTISASVPEGLMTPQPQVKVSVPDRGCANVYFPVESDGRLNGRVLSASGLPVSKAEIFLLQAEKRRYSGHWDASYSDENGRYAFRRIPPGKYILVIRFDGMTSQNRPFPLLYYPGVPEKTEAKLFNVSDGQQMNDFDLTMPPLPAEVTIEGRVVNADGKPVAVARANYLMQDDSVNYGIPLDESGRFSFKAYEGLKLVMQATQQQNGKWIYGDWVTIEVITGLKPITLKVPRQ